MPERLTAGLVTGCRPSESSRATRKGRGVAGAGGVADFDQAGGGLFGNAEGQARGAAHEHVGREAVDQDGGQAGAERAEICADQLDFAAGQSGGGDDVVDARRRGGSGADWALTCGMACPKSRRCNKRCYTQSIQPGGHIIEDDAPAFGEPFKLADGKWLGDVEEAKEDEGDEGVTPVGAAAEEGDPLAGDFVDDDELRVVAAGFAGDDGGGGDAEERA